MTDDIRNRRVAIVVVFYENAADTIRCIESVRLLEHPTYDMILVNNGSSELESHRVRRWLVENIPSHSLHLVGHSFRHPQRAKSRPLGDVAPAIHLLETGSNSGFAGGCNLGIVYAMDSASPDFVLILNNDALASPTLLGELLRFAEENPRTGVIGATILTYDDSRISSAGSDLNLWAGAWEKRFDLGLAYVSVPKAPRFVDKVEGSCLMVPNAVLDQVGLLDPSYFLYWEDADFCFRVKKAGYEVANIATATVRHKVSASTHMHTGLKQYYMQRNRMFFLRRHASQGQLLLGFPGAVVASIRTLFAIVGESKSISGVLAAFARGWMDGLTAPLASPPALAAYQGDDRLSA